MIQYCEKMLPHEMAFSFLARINVFHTYDVKYVLYLAVLKSSVLPMAETAHMRHLNGRRLLTNVTFMP